MTPIANLLSSVVPCVQACALGRSSKISRRSFHCQSNGCNLAWTSAAPNLSQDANSSFFRRPIKLQAGGAECRCEGSASPVLVIVSSGVLTGEKIGNPHNCFGVRDLPLLS